jgi:NADPH-dependent F420 reductase
MMEHRLTDTRRIAIIGGTGDQGKGLALRWAVAGYEIFLGSRDRARGQAAAASMQSLLPPGATGTVDGGSNTEAAAYARLVVLSVPFVAQVATLREIRDSLQPGTLLLDVTVPLEPAVGGRPTRVLGVWAGSAAEQAAELVPEGVTVVSAFQNVSAKVLADLAHGVDCDILVCGETKAHREEVRPLVEAIPGCRYVDAGPLANSRLVEGWTALLIGLNIRYKTHTGIRITGIE